MMSHEEARGIVAYSWLQVFPDIVPKLGTMQIVQANMLLETGYGSGWKVPGTNNWGAVIAGKKAIDGVCPDGTFSAVNESSTGVEPTCFAKYATPEEGCTAALKVMSRSDDEKQALLSADVPTVCLAMYRAGYYSFSLPKDWSAEKKTEVNVARRIALFDKNIPIICKALGEPNDTTGGSALTSPGVVASSGGAGELAAGLMLFGAVTLLAGRRLPWITPNCVRLWRS